MYMYLSIDGHILRQVALSYQLNVSSAKHSVRVHAMSCHSAVFDKNC